MVEHPPISHWKISGRLHKERYEDLLIQDIPNHVRHHFQAKDGPWAIGGLSMGGYGALRLGMKYSDRFASIYAHSSAFHVDQMVDPALVEDVEDASVYRHADVLAQREDLRELPRAMVIRPTIEDRLGIAPNGMTASTTVPDNAEPPLFSRQAERDLAKTTYEVIKRLQSSPRDVADISWLARPEVQERIVQEVEATYNAGQLGLDGVREVVDTRKVVETTMHEVVDKTIPIPRIAVVPVGELRSWFGPFDLDLSGLRFPPVSENLVGQALRTGETYKFAVAGGRGRERRLEDYVIGGLIDFDEISYDDHVEMLQDIASRAVHHFQSYLADDEQVEGVLAVHQREIARNIFSQMQEHYREDASGFETVVTAGFTPIKEAAVKGTGEVRNFRHAPERLSEIRQMLFGGFQHCLQSVMKFDSNPERMLAVILDRESQKWLRPADGQFQISYRLGAEVSDYRPDFVAELDDRIAMIEPKRSDLMDDPAVLAKRAAAVEWCAAATTHAERSGGKPWVYALIPHDAIFENQTIEYLLQLYGADARP